MGQYWKCVNLTKREFINPHRIGAGLKLWEQLANHPSSGTALVILCAAQPVPRGGGDLRGNTPGEEPVVGRWAGDCIAFVGDYAEDGDLPSGDPPASEIYLRCVADDDPNSGIPPERQFRDISALVAPVLEWELGGRFLGQGWKTFVRDGEPIPDHLKPETATKE